MKPSALALDRIDERLWNPRRRHDAEADAELAASIGASGVLQPILVRPTADPERYQLVAGQRRLAAARALKLETIPVRVEALTDEQALAAQIAENAARADVHPLDEAEALERLQRAGLKSAGELSEATGMPVHQIQARLRLRHLSPKVRKAFEEGRLEIGHANLFARIAEPEVQDAALARCFTRDYAASVGELGRRIREEFMLELKGAPFPLDDARVNGAAGPCHTCPKRSGNQAELFADVKNKNTCTDPVCFRDKAERWWGAREAEHRASKRPVVAKGGLPNHLVSLDERNWSAPGEKSYRETIGKHLAQPEIAEQIHLVRAEDRFTRITTAVEALPRKMLEALAKPAKGERSETTPAARAANAQQRAEAEARGAFLQQVAETRYADTDGARNFFAWLADAVIEASWAELLRKTAARRGLAQKGKRPEEQLHAWVSGATSGEALGLVVEILTARALSTYGSDRAEIVTRIQALAGADLTAMTKAAVKAAKAKLAAKAKPPKRARKAAKRKNAKP